MNGARTVALAAFFTAVQFYTSLEALSPTPPAGYVFLGRAGAFALAGVLVVSAAVAAFSLRGARALHRTPLGAAYLLWIGATLASALLGLDPNSGLQVVATMAVAAAFGLALVRAWNERGVAPALLASYLSAGTLAAFAGIVMALTHRPAVLYASSYGRAAGFFATANQFAEFANLFTFTCAGLALGARSRAWRLAAIAGTASGAVALAFTFSREGLFGAAAAALLLAIGSGRNALASLGVLGVVATAAVVATLTFPHHDPSDAFSRLRTLDAGVRVAELFPLTGAGPVDFWRVYPAIRPVNGAPPGTFGALHPHDLYVSLAGEVGLAGLCAIAWGAWRIGRALAMSLRGKPWRARAPALGVCAALVAVLVSGIFDTIGVVQLTFVWIPYAALALALAEGGAPV